MTRPLTHITITTGHTRPSWRHEIEPGALRATGELLAQALPHGRVPLPVDPAGLLMQITTEGRELVGTIWHDDAPLVTFGVALDAGAALWRMLSTGAPTTARSGIDPGRPPAAPWCAARMEPGIVLMADVAPMLGDLERCVAWAWLDRLGCT